MKSVKEISIPEAFAPELPWSGWKLWKMGLV